MPLSSRLCRLIAPRAYLSLADLLQQTSSPDQALATVTEDLRWNPGSRSLERRCMRWAHRPAYRPAQRAKLRCTRRRKAAEARA